MVERKNRTLIEVARTMLEESKLPTYFWAEAINTVCYTQNISIINQAQGKSPYQLMKNKKPTLKFLHVFGCKCFVLRNQGENLGKFEAMADESIFVGYATTRAYRVYNLRMNIVMELIHVVFDDKKIQGLVDEGNHDTLKFENEHIGDIIDSDEEECPHTNMHQLMLFPSMDTPHPSMDNISVARHTSTDNPSTDNSSSRNLNSFSKSMNLGGVSQSHRSFTNQEIPLDDQKASLSRSNLPSQRKWTKSHPFELIIGDAGDGVKTRSATQNACLYSNFLSQEEPKKVEEALQDADWVLAMQEELNQFERNKVWKLVPKPKNRTIIGTKWVYINKMDEAGIFTRNKARLVTEMNKAGIYITLFYVRRKRGDINTHFCTSGMANSHCVKDGVYKARERIHRRMADQRLLTIPASCR